MAGLTSREISLVEEATRDAIYDTGDNIFHLGEPADRFVVVKSGHIKCAILDESGTTYVTGIYGPGRPTGILSTLLGEPRMVSAVALETTEIGSLTGSDIQSLMKMSPKFARNIASLAAAMAADLIDVMAPLALRPAQSRLCSVLLALGEPDDPSALDSGLIVQGVSQEEIANMVGVTRTWISLMLTRMEREGILSRRKRSIVICGSAVKKLKLEVPQ